MILIRRHPVLTTAFALALALSLFFAAQFVQRALYWSDPAHQNQQLAPWMTVGYISHSWHLPGPAIDAEAGLPRPDGPPPLTLQQIADDRGVPVAEVIADVQAALLRLKARDAVRGVLDR